MRKLILTVLLATSAAMPAMAQDHGGRQRDRGNREASSEQRNEARETRRAERSERAEQPQREQAQAADRAEQRQRGEARQQAAQQQSAEQQVVRRRAFEQQGGERRNWGQRRSNNDGMVAAIERQQAAARAAEQQGSVEQRRDVRRDGRSRDGSQLGRAIEQGRARDGQVVVQRDRDGRAQARYAGSNHRWSNQWRGDRHYDWRNHRNHHRSIFRLGNYFDPYGSRYRRFSIGFSLFPSYYQSNYWLDDPWQYRLPPAYGPYRWVRYYNDALLVNVYTGQVVDVEHNFFW